MVSSVTNLGANAARRYIEVNSGKANTATQQLASGSIVSNPSYDPSSAAIGYNLAANIQSLQQASRNVSQATSVIQIATGFLGASQDVLTKMKELTVQANSDGIDDAKRGLVNNTFLTLRNQLDKNAVNARWGEVSLFTGGAGAATAAADVAAPAVAGGVAAAGTIFATIDTAAIANSQGMITGTVTDASITANGNVFDISIKVGDQTFKGTTTGAGAIDIILTSTTDSGNIIRFASGADPFGDAATAEAELRAVLGLGTGQNAVFTSASADASTTVTSFSAGSGTTAGAWALTYTPSGTNGTFKVTNGTEVYTKEIAQADAPGVVTFNNGVVLGLDATFDFTTALGQAVYNVAEGSSIVQTFQYAEKSTDILSVTFSGATVAALGLSGSNVLTKEDAADASAKIDVAIQTLNAQIGRLGGNASQFKFMSDTLRINIENSSAAKATFTDADIAAAMQDLQTYNGLGQIAQTVFTKSLNDQAGMAQMVQAVR